MKSKQFNSRKARQNMTNAVTKGILTCKLNRIFEKSGVNSLVFSLYEVEAVVEVSEEGVGIEDPDYIDGIPTWYKLSRLSFIPRKIDLCIV